MRTFMLTAMILALGACTPLSANHPLFAVADQTGPAPLTEGVWVAINSRCTRELAATTPLPDDCEPVRLHRNGDGSWQLSAAKIENGVEQRDEMRLIIVPAVATANAEAYAPLYLVEVSAREADEHSSAPADARVYGAFAPIGGLPAREAFFVDVECDAVLREGPLDGVVSVRDANGGLTSCTAENKGAVREAVRRAVIEELSNVDEARIVFVRP